MNLCFYEVVQYTWVFNWIVHSNVNFLSTNYRVKIIITGRDNNYVAGHTTSYYVLSIWMELAVFWERQLVADGKAASSVAVMLINATNDWL